MKTELDVGELKIALVSLRHPKDKLRISQKAAQIILLHDYSSVVNGYVRYFVIRKIGLGICEISLAGPEAKETYFLKE